MNAFSASVDVLFEDPNMAADAVYRVGGAGAGTPVRVMRRSADAFGDFNGSRFVADSLRIDVRVSEAPALGNGDTFEIGDELLEVRGQPTRDSERLVWQAEARVR